MVPLVPAVEGRAGRTGVYNVVFTFLCWERTLGVFICALVYIEYPSPGPDHSSHSLGPRCKVDLQIESQTPMAAHRHLVDTVGRTTLCTGYLRSTEYVGLASAWALCTICTSR